MSQLIWYSMFNINFSLNNQFKVYLSIRDFFQLLKTRPAKTSFIDSGECLGWVQTPKLECRLNKKLKERFTFIINARPARG